MSGFMERSWWVIIPVATFAFGVVLVVSVALVWVIPWYGLLSAFFVVGLVALWLAVVYDLVRRADMSLWAKVIWAIVVVMLPLFGLMAYYFSRPSSAEIRYRGEQVV